MKITKKQLKYLIKEEMKNMQEALPFKTAYGDDYDRAREEEQKANIKSDLYKLGREDALSGGPPLPFEAIMDDEGYQDYLLGYRSVRKSNEGVLEENPIDDLTQQTLDAASVKRNPDDQEAESRMRREINLSLAIEKEVVDMLTDMASLYKALPYKQQRDNTQVYRAIKKAYEQLKRGSSGGIT
jgi:hypothetical protein